MGQVDYHQHYYSQVLTLMSSKMSYMNMPDELKLAIWREVMPEIPIMHHMKITMPSGDDQVMEVSPVTGTKNGNHASMDHWNFSAFDSIAREVAALDRRVTIWQPDKAKINRLKARAKSKNGGEEPLRYANKVTINADIDVVHYKFAGDIFEPFLPHILNQPLFTGIKRVAVDWNTLPVLVRDFQPFQCFCGRVFHIVCPESIAKWLSHFKNIEVFYFVVKLTNDGINGTAIMEAGLRRLFTEHQTHRDDPILEDTARTFTNAWRQLSERLRALLAQPLAPFLRGYMELIKGKCFFTSPPTHVWLGILTLCRNISQTTRRTMAPTSSIATARSTTRLERMCTPHF